MSKGFFQMLETDREFLVEAGRMMLYAGELESELRRLLRCHGHDMPVKRATLEKLLKELSKNQLISKNTEMVISEIKDQRNYFFHNIFNLMSGELEETLLASKGLVELDVLYYIDKARDTAENIKGICEVVRRHADDITMKGNGRDAPLL